MISLALLLGLLGLVPVASGVILLLAARALSRKSAAIWCGALLLLILLVVLFLVRLLSYGNSIESTAFAPTGWASWLQLSYQVDSFTIFGALVIGVLASAVAAILMVFEPLPDEQAGQGRQWNHSRQMGLLLIALGAIFTAVFANSALWMVLGWGLAGLCAFIFSSRGQPRSRVIVLLATPCLAAIVLYLSLLPAITTRTDQRLDVLAGLEREPFWAACIMLAALLTPSLVLLVQQTTQTQASSAAVMSRSAVYTLMASPITFTVLARLALLVAGPGEVQPGSGSIGWRAFSLVIVWASAALALAAALLALRHAERATLPLFLSIQLLSWMLAGIAITGTAALNGALLLKLLRLLALGALLLAGTRKPQQALAHAGWWLAALSLSALPFSAGFSSAWLVTSGAIAAGPAWVAGIGVNWLALLLVTMAIARVGRVGAVPEPETARVGAADQVELLPIFLLLLLALLALASGIAPEVAVNFFTGPAASSLPVIASQAPGAGVQTNQLGLVSAVGTWTPGLFWLLALLLLLLFYLLTRQPRQAASVPTFLGGEAEAAATDTTSAPVPLQAEQAPEPERSPEGEL